MNRLLLQTYTTKFYKWILVGLMVPGLVVGPVAHAIMDPAGGGPAQMPHPYLAEEQLTTLLKQQGIDKVTQEKLIDSMGSVRFKIIGLLQLRSGLAEGQELPAEVVTDFEGRVASWASVMGQTLESVSNRKDISDSRKQQISERIMELSGSMMDIAHTVEDQKLVFKLFEGYRSEIEAQLGPKLLNSKGKFDINNRSEYEVGRHIYGWATILFVAGVLYHGFLLPSIGDPIPLDFWLSLLPTATGALVSYVKWMSNSEDADAVKKEKQKHKAATSMIDYLNGKCKTLLNDSLRNPRNNHAEI